MFKQLSVKLVRQSLNYSSELTVEKMKSLLFLLEELSKTLALQSDSACHKMALDHSISILKTKINLPIESQESLLELSDQEFLTAKWTTLSQEDKGYEKIADWTGEKLQVILETSFCLDNSSLLNQYVPTLLINLERFAPNLGPKWKSYMEEFFIRTEEKFKNIVISLEASTNPENARLASYYKSLNKIIDLRLLDLRVLA